MVFAIAGFSRISTYPIVRNVGGNHMAKKRKAKTKTRTKTKAKAKAKIKRKRTTKKNKPKKPSSKINVLTPGVSDEALERAGTGGGRTLMHCCENSLTVKT
jgi:hypothetical protein